MRKITLFIGSLLFLLVLFGCQREKKDIELENLKVNYSVYYLLPESLKKQNFSSVETTNADHLEIYQSECYYKLIKAYEYIDELIYVFNGYVDIAIDNDTFEQDRPYTFMDYNYFVTTEKDKTTLTVNNTQRKLMVTIDQNENGEKVYTGQHETDTDLFDFTIIENKEMRIELKKPNVFTKATITKDESITKTHIVYENDLYDYELVSIADEGFASVYYDYHHVITGEAKNFEVYNINGDMLYQTFKNNESQATGWYMHALRNYSSIYTINSSEFLVDEYHFKNIEGATNLYYIDTKCLSPYDTFETTNVLILGKLQFDDNLDDIIEVRFPFEAPFYSKVESLASDTFAYHLEVKNK